MPIFRQTIKNYLLLLSCCCSSIIAANPFFDEGKELMVIEAEHFAAQHLDEKRRWMVFTPQSPTHNYQDPDRNHSDDASNHSYIEVLPDTRTNHYDTLVQGDNFSNIPGQIAVLSYPRYFSEPGEYIVWVRAYSTGSEDNGVHVGLNGVWPESGQRLQLCEGKNKWTWSSAQRVESNHCGVPKTITLSIPHTGVHNIMVSMREDGFEFDQFILTKNKQFIPDNRGYEETQSDPSPLPTKRYLLDIDEYSRIIYASDEFIIENTSHVAYHIDSKSKTLAIESADNAHKHDFAYAKYTVKPKEKGSYTLSLVTLSESKGKSFYRIFLNNRLLAEFANPMSSIEGKEIVFNVESVSLSPNDVITVASKAVINETPQQENDTTYSQGRWRALVLKRSE